MKENHNKKNHYLKYIKLHNIIYKIYFYDN